MQPRLNLCLSLPPHYTNRRAPNTDWVTAITAWMMSCILFLFGALCSYAYLLWLGRKTGKAEAEEALKVRDEEVKQKQKTDFVRPIY